MADNGEGSDREAYNAQGSSHNGSSYQEGGRGGPEPEGMSSLQRAARRTLISYANMRKSVMVP